MQWIGGPAIVVEPDRCDGPVEQRIACRPAKPHAGDHLAFVAEQIFGDVPALVLVMDALAFGHFHIVEKGLAERRRSEEHTSELQSLMRISYAVFCLKKKQHYTPHTTKHQHRNHNRTPSLMIATIHN